LFATVVEKLKSNVVDDVPRILEAVFECTLTMITVNFEDYPEHRISFFEFLKVRLLGRLKLSNMDDMTLNCVRRLFHDHFRLSISTVFRHFSISQYITRNLWSMQSSGR
jgi:CRM1 C terminal